MIPAPLVSIVLPVYNGARYLSQALEAVLAQADPRWELLAVDDASTDETPAILAAFARRDGRIRIITNATNRKLPASLNIGFGAARGEYLTWTSDDNWHHPEAIGRLVDQLAAQPEWGLVYSDYTLVDGTGQKLRDVSVPAPCMLAFGNTVGGSFLYRRAVYEQLGPYAEDLFLAEDFDYWLRVASRFQMGVVTRSLYYYRTHEQSLTSQRSRQISIAHEQALRKNLPSLSWLKPAGRALAYVELARRACRWQRRGAVWSLLGLALSAEPSLLWRLRRWQPSQLFCPEDSARLRPHDLADLNWMLDGKEGIWRLAMRVCLSVE